VPGTARKAENLLVCVLKALQNIRDIAVSYRRNTVAIQQKIQRSSTHVINLQ
jgi:GTP:adenosylcobinamide-phosphate guanylyltransferase